MVPKKWGFEEVLYNTEYCAKLLVFTKLRKVDSTSLHHHVDKTETFFVHRGNFLLTMVNPTNAQRITKRLAPGDFQNVPRGHDHSLKCLSSTGYVIEASTKDDPADSYRVEAGQ